MRWKCAALRSEESAAALPPHLSRGARQRPGLRGVARAFWPAVRVRHSSEPRHSLSYGSLPFDFACVVTQVGG